MLNEFIRYLEAERRYSPLTLRNYRHDVAQFLAWLGIDDSPEGLRRVATEDIREWILHRTEKPRDFVAALLLPLAPQPGRRRTQCRAVRRLTPHLTAPAGLHFRKLHERDRPRLRGRKPTSPTTTPRCASTARGTRSGWYPFWNSSGKKFYPTSGQLKGKIFANPGKKRYF